MRALLVHELTGPAGVRVGEIDATTRDGAVRVAVHAAGLGFVDTLLTRLVPGPRPDAAMCRLCDTEACGAQRDQPCPITLAALRQTSPGTSIP